MEQETVKKEKKFSLPKGSTRAGTITIIFLLSAILFSFAGYSVAKKYTPSCPPLTKYSVCTNCKESNVDIVEQVKGVNYKFSLNTEITEYKPNTSKYVGLRICNPSISSCTVYGVENSKIAKAVSVSKFLLEFNQANIANCSPSGKTTYCILLGEYKIEAL